MGDGLFVRLASPALGRQVLLEVDAAEPVSGVALATALARHWPSLHWFAGAFALESIPHLPLQGRILLCDAPMGKTGATAPERRVNSVAEPAMLVVLRGPDPGGSLPLRRGLWAVGRGEVDMSVGDLGLSRRHALVRVDGTSIVLFDEGSSNGVWFAGKRILHRRLLIGDTFSAGGSILGVLPPRGIPTGPTRWPWDRLVIEAPEPGSRLAVMLIGALAPLGLGVGLYLLTHSVFFLAFCALGVLTGGLPAVLAWRSAMVFRRAWARATAADARRRRDTAPPVGAVAAGLASSAAVGPEGMPAMVIGHGKLAAWLCTASGNEPPKAGSRRRPRSASRRGQGHRRAAGGAYGAGTGAGAASPRTVDEAVLPVVPGVLEDSPVAISLAAGTTVWFPGPEPVWGPVLRAVLLRWLPLLAQGTLRVVVIGPAGFLPAEFAMLRGVQVIDAGARIEPDVRPTVVLGASFGQRGGHAGPAPTVESAGATAWLHCGDPAPNGGAEVHVDCGARRVLLEPSGGQGNQWLRPAGATGPGAREDARHRGGSARVGPGGAAPGTRGQGPGPVHGPERAGLEVLPEGISLRILARAVRRVVEFSAPETSALPAAPGTAMGRGNPIRAAGTGAATIIGDTNAGPLQLDLDADGPHFLVAGTTGSGKSELLRSLVLGLGSALGPDEVAFVLVDFKGAATLAPLAGLPHVQLLVSDLDAAAGERLLELLGHELHRREAFLARRGATDHKDYLRSRTVIDPPLPKLVVVIDEFRVFSAELPDALERVIQIATVGRSLGIHLVLSTQRPAGTVSAPLRANIGSVVALRTIGESESNDLIGCALAAGLDARFPGMAYLRRGSDAPVKFRARANARPSIPARLRARGSTLDQALFSEPLPHDVPGGPGARDQGPDAELAELVQLVSRSHSGTEPAPNPFSAALPAGLPAIGRAVLRQVPAHQGVVGLLDRVQLPAPRALVFDPHSTPRLLACGVPSSGIERVPELLLHAISRGSFTTPAFLLDGNGTESRLRAHPVVRGYFGPEDTWRINELLLHLGDPLATRPGLLLVCGLGGWAHVLEAGAFMRLEAMLTSFARTAAGAGRSLVICGDRELAGSRAASLCETRWYFPRGAGAELLMGWPRLRRIAGHPGRGVLLGPDEPAQGTEFQLLDDTANLPLPTGPVPAGWLRSDPLPGSLSPAQVPGAGPRPHGGLPMSAAPGAGDVPALAIGVCGPDNRAFTWSPGPCGIVIGHAGSGKGLLLTHLASLGGTDPGHTVHVRLHDELPERADGFLRRHPGIGRVLVERADLRGPAAARAMEVLLGAGLQVILSAEPGPRLLFELGLSAVVRDQRSFLVLDPQFGADADPSGFRCPPAGVSVPGRALVMDRGTLRQIQCVNRFD